MTTPLIASAQAELLAGIVNGLCTRPLAQFAAESRLDGESLADAVERYEVDYAWQVLGSERTCKAVIARLQSELGLPVAEAFQPAVAEALQLAAAQQPSDLLMSFDNDLPELITGLLRARSEPSR
ncbi:MAG: hypothetical protein A2486_00310 [Burkholderiales bacterium RIFOXYC12_FULL_65_23]|uniref:hypothetical protein n=1 Tax=Malikia spinosa TaxID=86180 RepID=UPI0008D06D6A|nr:MAG: hypothetical protein A2486_00310 [Burkholderiales bacterium RIFOXYC12_FULL_65_23]